MLGLADRKAPYLPMYPSHTPPSQPGAHSNWTCLKKSHRACFPHDSLLSLPPSLPLLSLTETSPLNSRPLTDWGLSRATAVVTLLPGHMIAVQALGISAWLEV